MTPRERLATARARLLELEEAVERRELLRAAVLQDVLQRELSACRRGFATSIRQSMKAATMPEATLRFVEGRIEAAQRIFVQRIAAEARAMLEKQGSSAEGGHR